MGDPCDKFFAPEQAPKAGPRCDRTVPASFRHMSDADALEWAVMVTAAARGADLGRLARGMRERLRDDVAWAGLAERAGVDVPNAEVRELVVERVEAQALRAAREKVAG